MNMALYKQKFYKHLKMKKEAKKLKHEWKEEWLDFSEEKMQGHSQCTSKSRFTWGPVVGNCNFLLKSENVYPNPLCYPWRCLLNMEDISFILEIRIQSGRETSKESQVCVCYETKYGRTKMQETWHRLWQWFPRWEQGKDAHGHSLWCQKKYYKLHHIHLHSSF